MNILLATHTKTFKHKSLLGLLLFFCVHLFIAQNKLIKLSKEFSFTTTPLFKLNTSHTKIIITTWDKSTIAVKAYSQGNVDNEFLQQNNQLWEIGIQNLDSVLMLNTDASKQLPVKFISSYSSNVPINISTGTILKKMLDPTLLNTDNTSIPIVLQQRLNNTRFNFEAYNKLGETYFKMWEYNLLKDLDEKSTHEIQVWSQQMASKLINTSKTNTTIATDQNVTYSLYQNQQTTLDPSNIEKIIELKIPKTTITYINSRFGSLTTINEIQNLQAKLKYTSLTSNTISGKKTALSVASAPVVIKKWNHGNLKLQYVKSAEIEHVENIQLEANSSKALIYFLSGKGEFKSTFSQLGVESVSPNFSSLSFLGSNSDLVLRLPNQAYNFVYSGEMSGIKIPNNKLQLKSLGDYRNLMLHGYSKTRNTENEIQMNMTNSQIILK